MARRLLLCCLSYVPKRRRNLRPATPDAVNWDQYVFLVPFIPPPHGTFPKFTSARIR